MVCHTLLVPVPRAPSLQVSLLTAPQRLLASLLAYLPTSLPTHHGSAYYGSTY